MARRTLSPSQSESLSHSDSLSQSESISESDCSVSDSFSKSGSTCLKLKRTMHGRRSLPRGWLIGERQSAIRSIGPPKIVRTCDTTTSCPACTRRVSRRIGRVVRRWVMTAARPRVQSNKLRSTSLTISGVSISALTLKGLTPAGLTLILVYTTLSCLIQISPLSAPLPRESQTIRSPLIQCKHASYGITQTAIIERKRKRLESPRNDLLASV